ncbi:MAG: class I SAM-dependent methyltransferase [Verrucomicrobiia bacterium]
MATISEAYRVYYTHSDVPSEPKAPTGLRRRFRLALRNGYLNARYGCHFAPSSAWGPVLYSAARRREADRWVRNLCFPKGPPRLLDLGCGNGHFLVEMRAGGWEAYGLDPDARAVEACRKAGLQVRLGMLAEDSFSDDFFAAITLNHVIEHLHDPPATLRLCFKFLQPGGVLWIATPNLNALGHTKFGRNWFALDPPRHLILFTPASLRTALERAGFKVAPRLLPDGGAKWHFRVSAAVAKGRDPLNAPGHSFFQKWRLKREARRADRQVAVQPELAEELVMLATKPNVLAGQSDT